MTRIAIDPITRIEGHLRIEVEHPGASSGTPGAAAPCSAGIERILNGRDPGQAWVFTQRLCGVCTHIHALTSVRTVENALGITVPANARIIRNLLSGAQFVHDHVIHFYHLHALDWVDVTSALKADPAATAALCQKNNPGWPNSTTAYFTTVRAKLQTFVVLGAVGAVRQWLLGTPRVQAAGRGEPAAGGPLP